MERRIGNQIKGYELKERIGSGGFGAVYRAYQTTVGREVAMKIILPGFANQPDFIRRFESEAHLIARLEHMNIVPLYDYWRDPDGAYLVMRWLRGGSLHDLIHQQGALSIEETVQILEQMAQALHIAHRNQVIHRDIKPGNILLDEDGNAYLADFGIAKDHALIDKHTSPDAIIGSPDYLAPEQARSEAVTPKTDIYSLGVVIYEMLAGEHPFPNLNAIERLYKHLNEPLPTLNMLENSISTDVNEVIQKATAKDPQQRFKDAIALAQALREAAGLDRPSTSVSLVELLTPREQEVLKLLIEGKSNREIAEALVVEVATVKWYNKNIYRKLNVRSRVQAIVKARELDLIVARTDTHLSSLSHLPEPVNPYKGLLAFQAADAQEFFGREKLIHKLLKRLQENVAYKRFLAIVGPSGSGKSSVVKAGLTPALWRGDLPGSDNWYIIDFLPGRHPLDELEIALTRVSSQETRQLNEHLRRDERGLVRVANLVLPDDGSELLIIIDQFEEVFTLVDAEAERQQLLSLLQYAVTEERSRVRVVVTLRADYYDRPLEYPDFGKLMQDRVETVLPLSAEELEQAVYQPAKQVGMIFEDGLVSRIVSDVHYQPGALPLLQYALTELFERRNGRNLTLETYQEIGGTGGALAKRADEIYLEENEAGRELVKQLFLRLVTLGEGAEDTRRRVERSELLAITPDTERMDEIIDFYAGSRLLSLDYDPSTRRPTVEVAHEAILREWDRLRQWLNDTRDDIRQERIIAQASEAWHNNDRDRSYLLTGTRLEQVATWCEQTELALTPLESEFIQASVEEAKKLEIAETERQAREVAQEQRSRTLLRTLVAVFAIATILSGGFGLFALNQRNEAIVARDNEADARSEAERNADENQRRALAFAANSALEQGEYELAHALAIESARDNLVLPESQRVLDRIANQEGVRFEFALPEGTICGVRWSPSVRYLMLGKCEDSLVLVWDTTTGELIYEHSKEHRERYAKFSSDGSHLAILNGEGSDAQLTIINIQAGVETHQTSIDESIDFVYPSNDGKFFYAIDYLSDSRLFDRVSLRDASSGEIIQEYVFEGQSLGLFETSVDGTLGIVGGFWESQQANARAIIFDVATGESLHEFEREMEPGWTARLVAISDDNSKVFIGGNPNYMIDITTGENLRVLPGETVDYVEPSFQYTSYRRTVSDGLLVRVNLETGEEYPLPQLRQQFFSLIGTDPNTWTAVKFESAQVWDISGRDHNNRVVVDHGDWGNVIYSPDGQYILSAGGFVRESDIVGSVLYVWDRETGQELHRLEGHTGLVFSLAWSPDGRFIASGAVADGVILWDAETGDEIKRFPMEQPLIRAVEFSLDTKYLIASVGSPFPGFTYDTPPSISIWDIETGDLVRVINLDHDEPHHGVVDTEMHPDGRIMYYNLQLQSPDVRIFTQSFFVDIESGDVTRELHLGRDLTALAFAQDGVTAFGSTTDGYVIEFLVETGEVISEWKTLDSDVMSIALNHDETFVATGSGWSSGDTAVSVWDVQTHQLLRRYDLRDADEPAIFVSGLRISPDDKEFVFWNDAGQIVTLPVDLTPVTVWINENRYIRQLICSERELYRIDPLCDRP